jgi:hypothetical protein
LTPFEYLLALVSILIGLAIADLAVSLHRLLRAWRTVRWDWLPLATALIVALLLLSFWWSFYTLGHYEVWTHYASFLVLAAYLFCLFLLASAALPDHVPESGIDLREFYRGNHRYFWSLFAFTVVPLSSTAVLGAAGRLSTSQILLSQIGNVVFLFICLSLAWTPNRRYHGVIVPLLLVLYWLQWGQTRLHQPQPGRSSSPDVALVANVQPSVVRGSSSWVPGPVPRFPRP